MARVSLFHVAEGDILDDDIIVNAVVIFGAGTVLTQKRIGLLKQLRIKSVDIESQRSESFSEPEILKNIDERFKYVQNSSFMSKIKSWIIEKISNHGNADETNNR